MGYYLERFRLGLRRLITFCAWAALLTFFSTLAYLGITDEHHGITNDLLVALGFAFMLGVPVGSVFWLICVVFGFAFGSPDDSVS